MSEWEVKYAKSAYAELEAIYVYIAEQLLEPETSAKQIRRIITAIGNLDEKPHRNPLYAKEPWKSLGLRKMPVDNYIVFYATNEANKEVIVLHVFYGGRDIGKILKKEAERADNGDDG